MSVAVTLHTTSGDRIAARTTEALSPLEDVVVMLSGPDDTAAQQLYCKVIETTGSGPFDSILVVTAMAPEPDSAH